MAKLIAIPNESKYEVYPVKFMHDNIKGYRIKVYCIFSEDRIYTLFNPTDWIENVNMMREAGSSCSTFTHDIIVTPTHHPEIFAEIDKYVSASDTN